MKHTSIKSVLAQIALVLDDRYWNETTVMEHAARAYRQMNLEAKFENKVVELTVSNHKTTLPEDLKYIVQIGHKPSTCSDSSICSAPYVAMRATTSSFLNSICLSSCLTTCPQCKYEYSISSSGVLTTNLCDGTIVLSYLGYPQDEDGYPLIIDDENVKEALMHYVFYRYWMQKDLMKEEGASQRMSFHLSMWSTLSKKALNANLPDVAQLENIKNNFNRLVPNTSSFSHFFSTLNSREHVNF
jgi:hypothetical protein